MISYDPRIEVRLIKAIKRKVLVDGLSVQLDRFGNLSAIDLTGFLSELGGVKLSKSIREQAGAFSVTLSDKPHTDLLESIYGLIEPMDMVEIRMAHNPMDYAKPGSGYKLPVVMRGFVSGITRNQSMSGDRPMRTVTVSGQDFGKVLGLIQIFYLNNSVVGENILSALAFFQKYSEGSQAKIVSAEDFIANILRGVINPYMSGILKLSDASEIGSTVAGSLRADISIEGAVSPFTVSSFNDTSLFSMMATVLDVGPFNEMFIEDREDGPYLVVRPTPFIAVGQSGDNFIQDGAWADTIDVLYEDVVAQNVSRTDHGVANYFWVSNSRWSFMQNERAQALAQTGSPDSFILFEYENCKAATYGPRKMQVDISLGPPDYSFSDSAKEEQKNRDSGALSGWIDKKRGHLAAMNKDNVLFEMGSFRLRGNEKIKAGMYIRLVQGNTAPRYYVSRVDHDFIPFQGFTTTVVVERGTGFVERAQQPGPYFNEMSVRGVS